MLTTSVFPSCLGFLEGKNVQQVKEKVKLVSRITETRPENIRLD